MTGTWYFHTIVCGPSAKWERGTVVFDDSGNATFTDFLDSAHYNPADDSSTTVTPPSGLTVTVGGDGTITMSGTNAWSSFQGMMGSRKNMWVATWTYSSADGSRALTIFQKKRAADDYTVWDIAGTGGQNPVNPNLAGNGPTRFAYHALNSGSDLEWEYSNARVGQMAQFWTPSTTSDFYPDGISSLKDVIYWDYSTPSYKMAAQYDLMWKCTSFGMRSDGMLKEYYNWEPGGDGSNNVVFTGRMTDDKTVVVGVSTKNVIPTTQLSAAQVAALTGNPVQTVSDQYFLRILQLNFIPTDQSLPAYTLSDAAGTYKFHEIGATSSGATSQASWAYGKMRVAASGATAFPLWTDSNGLLSSQNAFTLSYYSDTGSDGNTWTTFANFTTPDTGDAASRYYDGTGQPYFSVYTWWNALTNKTQSGSGVRLVPMSTSYYNEHATLSYNMDLLVMTRTDAFGYSMIVGLK